MGPCRERQHQTYGLTGTGITVGIISNSWNQVSGDLSRALADGMVDPNAQVIQDDPGSGEDEGLAMAEIVHEIAPGAHIIFCTGETAGQDVTESSMSSAINQLRNAGCDIICDDLFELSQPFYQPGDLIDQAIDCTAARF
jgi:hypothetical protein